MPWGQTGESRVRNQNPWMQQSFTQQPGGWRQMALASGVNSMANRLASGGGGGGGGGGAPAGAGMQSLGLPPPEQEFQQNPPPQVPGSYEPPPGGYEEQEPPPGVAPTEQIWQPPPPVTNWFDPYQQPLTNPYSGYFGYG